jgi:hypothetical protein
MSDGFEKLGGLPPGLPADPLDGVLVSALRGRKEMVAGVDLAGAALARVRSWEAAERNFARLARLNWWMRVATAAAAALIVAVVGIGYRYWPASTETADSVTDAATTASYTIDWSMVGMGVLGVTVVVVVLAALFTPERPQLRVVGG